MGRKSQSKRHKQAEAVEARLRRLPRIRLSGALVVLAALGLLSVFAAGLLLRGIVLGDSAPAAKTAAIVDQLSLSVRNPEFIASATDTLERAGYRVDYFPGEQVTVDFYRTLPSRDYDLIVLRVHSGLVREDGSLTDYVSLFTGEPYSETKYVDEQANALVGRSTYYEGAAPLFGVSPDFVNYSMNGRFDKTLIVMMGCDGLRSQRTAQAFLDRGASAFISWSQLVSADHTDTATERLLQKIALEGLAPADAVARTAAEVGPDPSYGAELRILAPES